MIRGIHGLLQVRAGPISSKSMIVRNDSAVCCIAQFWIGNHQTPVKIY